MTESSVTFAYEPERGVARLTFNRPSVFNALDLATARAFEESVWALRRCAGLRAVVISGAGKAFMAGGDVASFAADLDHADRTLDLLLNHMHPALLALREIDAPIIAGVNGVAAGAGLSLVLAADYVVASKAARFLLAYDKLGVSPDCGGTWFMARKIGRAQAFDLMLMGQNLDAEEARAAGLVNRISAPETYQSDLEAVVSRIASGPTRAFGQFKRLMDMDAPLAAHLEAERRAFLLTTETEDFRAAATAFVQKTAVSYKGR